MRSIDNILNDCFLRLKESENLSAVDCVPGVKGGPQYEQVWLIGTEVPFKNFQKDVALYIGFLSSFPYTLPELYYIPGDGVFIPHLDYPNHKLCLYEDGAIIPVNYPLEIIKDCIKRAKHLICSGLNGNNQNDFLDELNRYWIITYCNEPCCDDSLYLYNISLGIGKTRQLTAWHCSSFDNDGDSKTIVTEYSDELPADLKSIKEMFYVKKYVYLFMPSFRVPNVPPFCMDYQDVLNRINESNDKETYKNYIKKYRKQDFIAILFPLPNSSCYGGVYVGRTECRKDGYRHLSPYKSLLAADQHKKLKRLICYIYSDDRIIARSSGDQIKKRKFIVVGLGSVGSNLIFLLNGFNSPSFVFIDNDLFTVDNLGRHLCGFESVGMLKTMSIYRYLKSRRPEQSIICINDSIENYFNSSTDKTILFSSDALFLVTGNIMSYKFVIESIDRVSVSIPIFIIWLEPYGVAGHMLYIGDKSKFDFSNIFRGDYLLYKNNVIQESEYMYHSEKLIKRDAGCNGKYALYSENDILLFLSALLPIINNLIEEPLKGCKAYRWLGNLHRASQFNVQIKDIDAGMANLQEISL